MRLTLKLYIDRFSGNMLPLNYHYELASAIYKIMSQYETEYATWLHECGYSSNGKKQFKLFNFSDLYIPKYLINGDRMEVLSDYACWEISFLLPEGIYNFIHGCGFGALWYGGRFVAGSFGQYLFGNCGIDTLRNYFGALHMGSLVQLYKMRLQMLCLEVGI